MALCGVGYGQPPWFQTGRLFFAAKGGDRVDADAHTHKLFYDHWLDLVPIERSSRLHVELAVTS